MFMRFYLLTACFIAAFIIALASLSFAGAPAHAQGGAIPEPPAPIQNLIDEGAQVRFLGNDYGFDAWLTIKNGQEQYFYVAPDGKSFVMGLLFNEKGKLITVDQVQKLRGGDDSLLDMLAEDARDAQTNEAFNKPEPELMTPSEQLFYNIKNANWVPLGRPDAPVIYSFVDPQCGHCHAFIQDARTGGYLESGQVQIRIIPVGFKDETRAQAAFLLAAPNPEEHWFSHMDGDESALPARSEISQQGVQRNLSIMQSWQFNVTPLSVYRAKDGSVKIIRGRPQDLRAVIADIGDQG